VTERPVFYFDLGSPSCYLAAEQVLTALPTVPEWIPVLGGELGAVEGLAGRERVEREAEELGLQPVRWPDHWPPDTRRAMLAATYAKRIGRTVAFSLAAFRQAFAGGHDLGADDTVLIAGAACEMHPAAILKALTLSSMAQALDQATATARTQGVAALPAIVSGGKVFQGPNALKLVAEAGHSRAATV
jgi:2-hydroxychromene-2-carboxylate isomerase